MATREVDVQGSVPLSTDACWSIVRNFCAPWHPAIDRMQAEEGGQMRSFIVTGDSSLYKERLTWFSDSDRSLAYTPVQGIGGATRYDARLSVLADGAGASNLRWQATIEADDERCAQIAEGTEAIFSAGIDALRDGAGGPQAETVGIETVEFETRKLATTQPLEIIRSNGPATGPLCLFLHGIGGQKENWAAQVAAVGAVMPAAALDLRGYGGSALGAARSTVEDYCNDVLAVCDALGADKLVLCGLSYGAWIATSFAMRHSARLAGLVLAGGCTGMSEAAKDERDAFRAAREVPLANGQTPADFAPAVVDVIAGPDADETVRAALLASMSAIPSATYSDALHCFTNPPEKFDFSCLSMPVLMMTGSYDRLAPPAEIRSVAKRIWRHAPRPNVRFEEIDGAGHVCNLERPSRFNGALLGFLQQVRA